MRINEVTDRFVNRQKRSGCYMQSIPQDDGSVILRNTYGDRELIAEIYDYRDINNYRLRIFPTKGRYDRTSMNNRISAVLVSVQKSNGRSWDNVRYSSHIRYGIKIYDRKLEAEYGLREHFPLEFAFNEGRLTLDYKELESKAFPTDVKAQPIEPTIDPNSNIGTLNNRLTSILQGV